MSTETPRPGLARTIRDSVRHGPFGPLTPDEAREAAADILSWLTARLTDDDVVGAAAEAISRAVWGDDTEDDWTREARAALAAAADVIGGGSDA